MTRNLPSHVILIVENDELLQTLTVDIMEGAGFVALRAGNADEAMAILEARSDIALLLTSVSMPSSMNGLKLAHAVRNRWPSIKIIVVSGQTRLSECDLPMDSRLLIKPYAPKTMISEIRTLIGSRVGTHEGLSRVYL
jgi:two-component system, response regulator PdtaR